MSKAFKGKTCAYCGKEGSSETADHVFAREFLPVEKRGNQPKVSACFACNTEKSRLEHYLAAVLPFGARHADGLGILQNAVPHRLAKNQRLYRELAFGQTQAVIPQNGAYVLATGLPFESEKLSSLVVLIAKGLTRHHWDCTIPADHNIRGGMVSPEAVPFFAELLAMNGNRITGNIGDGALVYEGLQSLEHLGLTIWRLSIYGGVMMSGDERVPEVMVSDLWVTSTTPRLPTLFDLDDAA
jgi:hypothetical protein